MSRKTDFKKYLTLTLNLKVINIIRNVCCIKHMICKHCGDLWTLSVKINKDFFVFRAILQVLSMCDLDLCPQGHISYLKSSF